MTPEMVVIGGYLTALLCGIAFGAFYFFLLWRGTSGFVQVAMYKGRGTGWLLLGFAARLASAGGALSLAIWAGANAGHLLVATLGFTVARLASIRHRRWHG